MGRPLSGGEKSWRKVMNKSAERQPEAVGEAQVYCGRVRPPVRWAGSPAQGGSQLGVKTISDRSVDHHAVEAELGGGGHGEQQHAFAGPGS
jgi:hypothetical protein